MLLKCCNDGEEVMSEGKSFHIHAPATGKARRPTEKRLTLTVTAGSNRLSLVVFVETRRQRCAWL